MDSIMGENDEELSFDTSVLDDEVVETIKEEMSREFEVEKMRKLKGKYSFLITYYAESRMEFYLQAEYMFEDLAEVAYADFENWTESDFKRLSATTQRNLRDHLFYNGISIEKRSGYAMAKALYECLKDPDAIPMFTDRNIPFIKIRPGGVSSSPRSSAPSVVKAAMTDDEQDVDTSIETPEKDPSPYRTPASRTDGNQPSPTSKSRKSSYKLTDVTKCIRSKYEGLPDEDFDAKVEEFRNALEIVDVTEESDKLKAVPYFLKGQAALTYRTAIKHTVSNVDEALKKLKDTFISEEARRANDTIWESIHYNYIRKAHGTKGSRDTMRKLFAEVERLRNCTSHSHHADEKTIEFVTRAKLLAAVGGVDLFQHVRANPPDEYLRLRNALYDAATQADTGAVKSKSIPVTPGATLEGVLNQSPATLVTDRRFNKYNPNRHKKRNTFARRTGERSSKGYRGEHRCWVCNKRDFHSSNHPKKDRERVLKTYISDALDSSTEDEDRVAHSGHDDSCSEGGDTDTSSFATAIETATYVMKQGADAGKVPDFIGIALDTCCTRYCTSSLEQFRAYCNYTGQKSRLNHEKITFSTSGGKTKSLGFAWVHIPFGRLCDLLRIKVFIFDYPSTAPMLLSYHVMKLNKWNMIITEKRLQSGEDPTRYVTYKDINNLPVYKWDLSMNAELRLEDSTTLYTVQELRNIHRRTGHQSPNRIMSILNSTPRAMELSPDTRAMLVRIARSCRACQVMSKAPERFRFVIHDDAEFNHEVLVDIFQLSDGNVLHVICSGTKYQLGRFLPDLSAKTCWATLRKCWIDILSGPPDIVKSDSGPQFAGKEFKDSANAMGIHVEVVPTEAHNKIGLIERYHKIVRDVYEKLKIDDPSMDPELRLSATFRCVNDTSGFDGVVPTLLVFGTYPKIGNELSPMSTTTVERANAVRNALKLAAKLMNEQRMKLASKRGPTANMQVIESVKRLGKNAPVLVYRENKGWVGPLQFVCADDHGVWVRNPSGKEVRVSLHVVKPYVPESWVVPTSCFAKVKDPVFLGSRKEELTGMLDRKVFRLVPRREARNHRVYHGSWIDTIKSNGQAKSRIVVCATNDYLNMLTYSPTIQRTSTRLSFAYAACRRDFIATCRDVTQAFTQSTTKLRRPVYMELPHEMRSGNDNMVLKVEKPLYGLPESPINWFATYVAHYKSKLGMKSAPQDPCLLSYVNAQGICEGMVLLQVDDSTTFGTRAFHEKEDIASKRFKNHGAKRLSEIPILHNGAQISVSEGVYKMDQSENLRSIHKMPSEVSLDEGYKLLKSENAAAAYPASLTRCDILCYTSYFAQVTRETYSRTTARHFNKFVQYLQENAEVPLSFVPLDQETLHVAVLTDASFSTTVESCAQLGIVVLLRDASGKCNFVHASSTKCKRKPRSVLAAEMFGLMDGFDCGYVIRDTISRLMSRKVELHVLTDSRSAYHITTTLVNTKEKRPMLDVHFLREAYERREITKISWISGSSNIADCLTKRKNNGSLLAAMKTNQIALRMEGWIDRDLKPVHVDNDDETQDKTTLDTCLKGWAGSTEREDRD